MLYPIVNNYRFIFDLDGIWDFKADPQKLGEKNGWHNGFKSPIKISVPGSWNEQLGEEGLAHYTGDGWYCRSFTIPHLFFGNRKFRLRIGSADYYAKVWVNGVYIGENVGGFLPFEFDVTPFLRKDNENIVVILVNNELNHDTIPQGISAYDYIQEGRNREETYPPVRYDFFPYGGIHRPVLMYITPEAYIADVTAKTNIGENNLGIINVETKVEGIEGAKLKYALIGETAEISRDAVVRGTGNDTVIEVNNCKLWSPEDPYLYTLKVDLYDREEIVDSYSLRIGIREVAVQGTSLLLNGKKIFLKGFGKHEDFPIIGKGMNNAVMVKDFTLLKWIHANSFRTSHYPYTEEIIQHADTLGILVINEVPAVSLDFRKITDRTMIMHKQLIQRLYDRDKNHPSVIMWAVGNEPNLVNDTTYFNGTGRQYWKEVIEFTRSIDSSRPITIPNCQVAGRNDPVFEFCDVISLNRYYGWYEYPGQLDKAISVLEEEMDYIADKYGKPILISEFGADTIPGFHATEDQMFTEEYQSRLINRYCTLIESKNYTIGEHVWNFADFKTAQHSRRVVLNFKGVFTRTREPKLAAFTLQNLWKA